jgi:hypothetical protein
MFGIKSVHEDGMFNFSSKKLHCCNSFHEKRDNYGSKYFQTNQLLKPLEVRMGKGKGAVEYWAAVKPGIMFEVGGVPVSCKEALRLALKSFQ